MEEYINNKTVVENDMFKLFKDSVTCPLCKNILINPFMCIKCQKVYCKRCIDIRTNNNEKCLNGCIEQDYEKYLLKNDILSKLKFKCLRCEQEIEYSNVQSHYDSCSQNITTPDKLTEEMENSNTTNTPKEESENRVENQQDSSNIEKTSTENTDTHEIMRRLTREEMDKLKKEGKKVTYISGKNNYLSYI